MTRTTWIIGLVLAVAAVVQLTLMATGVAGIPPDDRGKPSGAPASVQLTPDPAVIECDGIDASTVTVRVTDALGRSVADGTLVHFDAQYGFVDPVEATTQRGEASTQASLYEYARNFAGQTGVDVFVDGGLRASIGIDCAPEGPPCDPATPPAHPQSPPCPEPGACNFPFSPPVHSQSPPCPEPTPACNFPFSPPLHVMSPPCGTPTPDPCHVVSPPCDLSAMKLDGEPLEPGIQQFVLRETGTMFSAGVHVDFASEPYAAYQWVIEWPLDGLSFGANIAESGPALGFSFCVDSPVPPVIDPAYDGAHAGGCVGGQNDTDYTGEVTTFDFTCESDGVYKINLISRNVASGIYSSLIQATGDPINTATEGLFIECVSPPCGGLPCPTATPRPTATPLGTGTLRFESYEPVTAAVGVPFELSIEAVDVTGAYQGYEWLVGAPGIIDVVGEQPATGALLDTCVGIHDVAPGQHYGGCIELGDRINEIIIGRLTTLTLICLGAGQAQVALLADSPFGTRLITSQGNDFGGPDTSVIDVTCVDGAPTATPSPSVSARGHLELPPLTPTPAPVQRGQRGLQ